MFSGVFITTIKFVGIQGPYKRVSHDARKWCQDFVLQGVELLQKTLVVASTLLTSMAICQWTLWNSQVVPSIKCNYKIQVIGSHFKSDITWGWYSDWHPCIEFASRLRTMVNPHNLISYSEASKNFCIVDMWRLQEIKCYHVTQWAPSKHIQDWQFADSA